MVGSPQHNFTSPAPSASEGTSRFVAPVKSSKGPGSSFTKVTVIPKDVTIEEPPVEDYWKDSERLDPDDKWVNSSMDNWDNATFDAWTRLSEDSSGDRWWSEEYRRSQNFPGPGILPVLALSRLHDGDHELFKITATLPEVNLANTSDLPEDFSPPTFEELQAALPHPNAYYCWKCNGWVIVQKTKNRNVPIDRSLHEVQWVLPEPRGGENGPECTEYGSSKSSETHHFHCYPTVMPADRLDPPYKRQNWEGDELPLYPVYRGTDANDGPFFWLLEPYKELDRRISSDTPLLDVHMCCRCPVNMIVSQKAIRGVIPPVLLADLLRERLTLEKGPQRVASAMELVSRIIEGLLWKGVTRPISTQSETFKRDFGSDAQAMRLFDHLGFALKDGNILHPPSVSGTEGSNIRAKLLRAWLEVNAWHSYFVRRYPIVNAYREGPPYKNCVQSIPATEELSQMMGAHPSQIPRGMIEQPQAAFDLNFTRLGLTQGSYSPELLQFAYNKQLECDPQRTPHYYADLVRIFEKQLPSLGHTLITDSLQIFVVSERSKNRWTPEEFSRASYTLGFGADNDMSLEVEDVHEEFIERAFSDLMIRSFKNAPAINLSSEGGWNAERELQESGTNLRAAFLEALRIVGEGLGSERLVSFWKNSSSNTSSMDPQKAYSTLGVSHDTQDELLLMVYQMRVADAPGDLEKMKDAMSVIAQARRSERLAGFLQSGIDPGDPEHISRPEWPRGLNQLGNTCYLNSLLQYFYTIKDLRDAILHARPIGNDKDKGEPSDLLVVDKDKFSDAQLLQHRVGGRLVTRKEVERSKKFLTRLGELFHDMEWAESNSITPSLELAKLALVTSKDEEEDDAAKNKPSNEAGSSASTDATLVDESAANTNNASSTQKPSTTEGASTSSTSTIMPSQPASILGKRIRDSEMDRDSQESQTKPKSPRRDGFPAPERTIRIQEPSRSSSYLREGSAIEIERIQTPGPSARREELDMELDDDSDAEISSLKVSRAESDYGGSQSSVPELIEEGVITITSTPPKPIPPPLPPRKQATKSDSTMMFGKQHDVSECMDNCMFQIETALLKFDGQSDNEEDIQSVVKRLFYGKLRQIITPIVEGSTSDTGKITVHEKQDLFSHLPVNVSEEGFDIYDGLGGYFYDVVEYESKKATMEVSLVNLPPILQIQLQRVQFNRETLQAYKSQAYIKFGETLYMDRFLDSANAEKRSRAKELQAKIRSLRERVESLSGGEGPSYSKAIRNIFQFFDKQEGLDLTDAGVDVKFIELLGVEGLAIEEEVKRCRNEIVELKGELENLWKDDKECEYELTSVFIHRGSSPSFGHYFFYARCLPDRPDDWFKYNDSDVSLVSKDEVLANTTGSTANPYLLVFARKGSGVMHTVNRQVAAETEKEVLLS